MTYCKDHTDYYDFCTICEIEKLKKANQELLSIIDRAYWRIEQGDRISALRELATHAKPRDPNAPHWLTNKKQESE